MANLLDPLFDLIGDNPALLLSVFVFFAAAALALGAMSFLRAKKSVSRRVSDALTGTAADAAGSQQQSLRTASLKTAQKLIDYTAKYYAATDTGNVKLLQSRLIQAGFLNPRAAGFYFVARVGFGVAFLALAFFCVPADMTWSNRLALIGLAALLGFRGGMLTSGI